MSEMEKLNPAVSIIVPCRNEVAFIDRCLGSIFSFTPVQGGVEVIVVDGISEDGTREILARWMSRHPNLKVLDNPKGIVPTALNIGIKEAKGDWIIRLDAHADYPKNYLELCIETSCRTGADNVGGVVRTLTRDHSREALLVQALTTHRFGIGTAKFRLNSPAEGPADTVPYGCFKRRLFDQIGFYHEALVRNQDYELNCRMRRAGKTIWLDPRIEIYYYNQSSLRGLLHQAFLTAKWNAWMWYLSPYTFAPRHAVPAVFVLVLMILLCAAVGYSLAAFPLILLLALYTSLALIASGQQSVHYGGWMAPLLPFLFFMYHVSYGVGTLWGIVRLLTGWSPVKKGWRKRRIEPDGAVEGALS